MSLTKIGSIGINTGIAFAGVTTIVTLNTANDALSIGATVNVGSGITLGASGDIFATGVTTSTTFSGAFSGSGANITALNASNISSGTVPTARLGSGTASSSTFLRGDSSFQTVDTNLVADTTPQLGGNLDVNTKNILFGDSSDGSSDDVLIFGAGSDLKIYHDGTNNVVKNTTTGELRFMYDSQYMLRCIPTGAVRIYYANSTKAQTTNTGFMVNGNLELVDGNKLYLGDSGDLQIYHVDNTDKSHIKDTSGILYYESDNHYFKSGDSGEFMAKFVDDGAVELYHNNSKKFETTSAGVSVTGAAAVSGAITGDTATIAGALTSNGTVSTGPNVITNADGGGHLYFKNNSSGANFSSHFQTYSGGVSDNVQTHIHYYHGGYCELQHQGDSVLRTLADGVQFRDGGAVKGQFTDEGLCFGTDTASANALDDYEEGTWTPALTSGYSSISYHHQNGYYTKIGNVVHFSIYIYVYQATGDAAAVNISLPFTSMSTARRETGGYTTYDNATYSSSWNEKSGCSYLIGANYSYIRPIKRTNGAQIYGNDTELGTGGNNRYFHLSGMMYV